jgi:hypothetical protein
VAQLEQQLAEAVGRAETAEQRAAVTEGQLAALKLSVAALQRRLEQASPPADPEPKPPAQANRQARRQAERDARRHRH